MLLSQVRIVLVETSHPGNVGSTARAMKTMGLNNLYLINPCDYLSDEAFALSAGAQDILFNAKVFTSLEAAIADVNIVFGTSARSRGLHIPVLSPAECMLLINSKFQKSKFQKSNIAIVFGRERIGLTNKELLHCNYHIQIPTEENFSSLNLAQSVQIVAYELRKLLIKKTPNITRKLDPPASIEQVLFLYRHWVEILDKISFLKPSNAERIKDRLLRMLNKLQLDVREVRILRGMLTKIQYIINKKTNE